MKLLKIIIPIFLLTILFCFTSNTAHAQCPGNSYITINNTSPCTVWYGLEYVGGPSGCSGFVTGNAQNPLGAGNSINIPVNCACDIRVFITDISGSTLIVRPYDLGSSTQTDSYNFCNGGMGGSGGGAIYDKSSGVMIW